MNKITSSFFLVGFFIFTPTIFAADISVTPVIIDERVKARDIVKHVITIKNNTTQKFSLFAVVHNIEGVTGGEEFTDPSLLENRDASLANWILFSRGEIELLPRATTTVPLTVEVPPTATPGKYYAFISLLRGTNRDDAEERADVEEKIIVNFEVEEDIHEVLQMVSFVSTKKIFQSAPLSFTVTLENTGNKPVIPKGEVILYNSQGKEVGAGRVNEEEETISIGEKKSIQVEVSEAPFFGKVKAHLSLEYGIIERGTITDTVFINIIPWKLILGIFLALSTLIIFIVHLIHIKMYSKDASAEPPQPIVQNVQKGITGGEIKKPKLNILEEQETNIPSEAVHKERHPLEKSGHILNLKDPL